tara:strand:+ start:338 stop:562 length:225 start_codon:yes stop_codon:yes gene_type:complete
MIESIKQIINQILKNTSREELVSIRPDLHLQDDIGFDSLDLAELTVHIESKYGIDIFEDEIIHTVDEILKKLKN